MPEAHDEPGDYLSIGEVLALLLEEFPDVTISKIRFLESQGLIAPERTSSGYRKFYETDIELLRVILHEQRDNYLPLRVIKNRLETGEIDPTGESSRPHGIPRDDTGELEFDEAAGDHAPAGESSHVPASHRDTLDAFPSPDGEAPHEDDPAGRGSALEEVPPSSISAHPAGHQRGEGAGSSDAGTRIPTSSTVPAAAAGRGGAASRRTDAVGPGTASTASPDEPGATTHVLPGVLLERSEVCALVGVTDRELGQLEEYGVVAPGSSAGVDVYDEHAVATIEVARDLMRAGVDARHLRSWRTSVEREAGLYEQLIAPRLRQRNPESRAEAMQRLRDLDVLGARLRDAMMRSTLAHHLDH